MPHPILIVHARKHRMEPLAPCHAFPHAFESVGRPGLEARRRRGACDDCPFGCSSDDVPGTLSLGARDGCALGCKSCHPQHRSRDGHSESRKSVGVAEGVAAARARVPRRNYSRRLGRYANRRRAGCARVAETARRADRRRRRLEAAEGVRRSKEESQMARWPSGDGSHKAHVLSLPWAMRRGFSRGL